MDYKARFYDAYITHFSQPDPIIPDPSNPQSFNRYSYALNNPIRYNDPSGHCADAVTMPVCALLTTAGPPGWVIDGVILVVSLAIIGYAAHQVLSTDVRKPLTKDEQEKVDHLEKDSDDFLKEHPDLEKEAQQQANGEKTKYDHVKKAKDWVAGLENDIAHLEKVRRSRDDDSQAAIDRAIEHGQRWIDAINRKLYGKE
jgi:hypothetical protein